MLRRLDRRFEQATPRPQDAERPPADRKAYSARARGVDGRDIQFFEYGNEEEAAGEAALVSPEGSQIGTHIASTPSPTPGICSATPLTRKNSTS